MELLQHGVTALHSRESINTSKAPLWHYLLETQKKEELVGVDAFCDTSGVCLDLRTLQVPILVSVALTFQSFEEI